MHTDVYYNVGQRLSWERHREKTGRVEMHATGHTELFCQEVAAGLQAPRLG
jgi:hypothetical protein